MGKRTASQGNSFERRENNLAKALITVGKPEDDKVTKDEIATENDIIENKAEPIKEIEEIKEVVTEVTPTKVDNIDIRKESAKEPKTDVMDLFIVKKKEKIRKRQKNLWLKEENIDTLEDIAKKTGYNEGELVDILIENYLKLLKMK